MAELRRTEWARKRRFGLSATLVLKTSEPGVADSTVVTLTQNWNAGKEIDLESKEAIIVIEIEEAAGLTANQMATVDRAIVGGIECNVTNIEQPFGSPSRWRLLAKEIKVGGV